MKLKLNIKSFLLKTLNADFVIEFINKNHFKMNFKLKPINVTVLTTLLAVDGVSPIGWIRTTTNMSLEVRVSKTECGPTSKTSGNFREIPEIPRFQVIILLYLNVFKFHDVCFSVSS